MTKCIAPLLASIALFGSPLACGGKSDQDVATSPPPNSPVPSNAPAHGGKKGKKGKKGRHNAKPHGRRGRKGSTVCARVSCTDAQLTKLKPMLEQIRQELKLDRAALQEAHEALALQYRNSSLDAEAIATAMASIDAQHKILNARVASSLGVVHEELDRGQRMLLAEAIEEDGPMGVLDPRHGYRGSRPRFGTVDGADGNEDAPSDEEGETGDRKSPDGQPSGEPDGQPSGKPGGQPSGKPGGQPSGKPGGQPSGKPSGEPDGQPSGKPGEQPA